MERICCIYGITNPKGMVYVGQSVNVYARFSQYKNHHCKSQPLIYKSLLDFGSENHKFEILELCDKERLNERERYWQEHYSNLELSLNLSMQRTQDKPQVHHTSSKQLISKHHIGHSHNKGFKKTKEAIEKSRQAHIGSKRSESSKEKMRNAANYKSKSVIQYDENMNYISEFRSSHEASRQTGCCRVSINRCCRDTQKLCNGFKWSYKN